MNDESGILLVGCGNMGRALVKGWLADGRAINRIHVIDPSPEAAQAARDLGVRSIESPAVANTPVNIVILAVKPQQLETVLPIYRDLADSGTLVLSIAAGKPIEFYEQVLSGTPAIVRGMPNAPAAIGEGMTVLSANAEVTAEQRTLCESLMAAVGDVAWLEDEALMDVVTAVSGSGPAYIFLLIECLIDAALALGLDRDLAQQLAEKTVSGSGAYALMSDVDATELRRRVTSPGGTTEAALGVLMDQDALAELIRKAVRAASERGRELA
jgi:pyrroline-5-carboxylate reductase